MQMTAGIKWPQCSELFSLMTNVQVRKLRPREVKWCALLENHKSRIQSEPPTVPKPCLHTDLSCGSDEPGRGSCYSVSEWPMPQVTWSRTVGKQGETCSWHCPLGFSPVPWWHPPLQWSPGSQEHLGSRREDVRMKVLPRGHASCRSHPLEATLKSSQRSCIPSTYQSSSLFCPSGWYIYHSGKPDCRDMNETCRLQGWGLGRSVEWEKYRGCVQVVKRFGFLV